MKLFKEFLTLLGGVCVVVLILILTFKESTNLYKQNRELFVENDSTRIIQSYRTETGITYGSVISIVSVMGCQYLVISGNIPGGIIHMANCPNQHHSPVRFEIKN